MKLPSLPFLKKQAPKEYFLALLLQEELVQAVVFEESNGTIHIVGEGKSLLPAPIDDTSFEELLNTSDKAISQAESKLPDGVQSHKTIFGVRQDWTENLQIKKEHLGSLKKLCDELELQPIGFLVFAEAIAHLLQKEEGAPVSGVLVGIGTRHITATVLRAGRVIAYKQAPLEEQLPKAVDHLLAQFDLEILPSRIILLDTEKKSQTQQFVNHTWSKQLPFLHVPQITPLREGFEIQAILFGTATQMGFDILDMPISTTSRIVDETPEETANEKPDNQPISQELPKEQATPEQISADDKQTAPVMQGNNFGFVNDEDVLENAPAHPKVFPGGEDENSDELADETFAEIPEEVKEHEEKSKLPGLGTSGVMLTEGMQKVFGNLKKIPFSRLFESLKSVSGMFAKEEESASSRLKLLAIPLILLLCVGGLFWYFFGLKATATLFIDPKHVEASQDVTFSSTDNTNIDSHIIGTTVVPVQEDGKVSTDATGKKDVGDKAKGTVTVYNNDDSSHTLSAGTTITSANGLKFITAKDSTIASASGDIFSGTKPGTANVDVTAADIGTEYNLPSGTKFAIGSSTVIAAKNDNAFSGGTKKSVTIVSQADLDKLTKDLTDSLSDKAKQDMQKNIDGKALLPIFLTSDTQNQQFDHKVGDEASSVNLSATISFKTLTYSKDDLNKLAVDVLQISNQNESISPDNLSVDIQNPTVAKDKTSITAKLAIKAGLLPKIDSASVAQRLAGKSFDQATTILSDIPQLSSVKATLSPNLFFLPHIFPRIASHIMVGISSND